MNKIERVQNAAARLVLKQTKFGNIAPVLSQLHWLPSSIALSLRFYL